MHGNPSDAVEVIRSLVKIFGIAAAILIGAAFGFWLGMVLLLSYPDLAPALPDGVWVLPYASAVIAGGIGFFSARALVRRFFID